MNDQYTDSDPAKVEREAVEYLELFYREKGLPDRTLQSRIAEVRAEISKHGTYTHTVDELEHGCRVAWRNAGRCINRIQWRKLELIDQRHATTVGGWIDAIRSHCKSCDKDGVISSTITVFPAKQPGKPGPRIWSPQFVRYAYYSEPRLGDPANKAWTETCLRLGWEPPATKTAFDILPLVIQPDPNKPVELLSLPKTLLKTISIRHPDPSYSKFNDLGLKWTAVPFISDFALSIGGVEYTACPFNGWFMQTEIARDLADPQRYNMLEPIGRSLGLDTSSAWTLWKDRAFLELNAAILHSFMDQKYSIVDHQTASDSFITHYQTEMEVRGYCPGDWVWITPPIGGSTTSVFHQEMINFTLKPFYNLQNDASENYDWEAHYTKTGGTAMANLVQHKSGRRKSSVIDVQPEDGKRVIIAYGSETGKAQGFARKLAATLSVYRGQYKAQTLDSAVEALCEEPSSQKETILLAITSTAGQGEAPLNASGFRDWMAEGTHQQRLEHIKFCVLALGNSSYVNFCQFGRSVDTKLSESGARPMLSVVLADELDGQENTFATWASQVKQSISGRRTSVFDIINVQTTPIPEFVPATQLQTGAYTQQTRSESSASAATGSSVFVAHGIGVESLLKQEQGSRGAYLVKLDITGHPQFGEAARGAAGGSCSVTTRSPVVYSPGDHLVVHPSNRDSLVDAMIARLGINGIANLAMAVSPDADVDPSSPFAPVLSGPFTQRQLLADHIDITTPVSQPLLALLANYASDGAEAKALMSLASDPGAYAKWVERYHPGLALVLIQFTSIQCSLNELMHLCTGIQPRYYSISSSSASELHLTVGKTEWTTPRLRSKGKLTLHKGVASSFLIGLHPGGAVRCSVRSCRSFHLPSDPTMPVVMIGAGSGIAPFRSFWQGEEAAAASSHEGEGGDGEGEGEGVVPQRRPLHLVFGCRNENEELHAKEVTAMRSSGVLASYHVAYSRPASGKKMHAHDIMGSVGADVWELVANKQAAVYVCGSIGFAENVRRAVKRLIKQSTLRHLYEAGLFCEDIFSTKDASSSVSKLPDTLKIRENELLRVSLSPKQTRRVLSDDTKTRSPSPKVAMRRLMKHG
jgi:nitric oxide synthase oxygenase domain/subunit/sulfite reductase alpha subunit-like flavoprotein